MGTPTAKTLKQLFALSKNRCAFPKCTVGIVLEENNTVVGEVCHIKGLKFGSARHDELQSDEDRNAFSNLILMCSIHHKVIDEDEDSYTVERLLAIKGDHESLSHSMKMSDDERRLFDQLLDERIRLILEHEKEKTLAPELTSGGSGPIALAKQMAERKLIEERRASIYNSSKGFEIAISSVNTIFTSITERYDQEQETFSTIGIELNTAQLHRVIGTNEFGSQIVLEGLEATNYSRSIGDLRLVTMLFGKRPISQPGCEGKFYTDRLSGETFEPDFDRDLNAVWVNDVKKVFTESQLVDKIFSDLLNLLENERKMAETLPEGQYRRAGSYVDMFGKPIGSEDEFEDW